MMEKKEIKNSMDLMGSMLNDLIEWAERGVLVEHIPNGNHYSFYTSLSKQKIIDILQNGIEKLKRNEE